MRKMMQARYAPYLRMRYRAQRVGGFRSNPKLRSLIYLLRFVLCVVCFVFAVNGMTDHFRAAVKNICDYRVSQLVSEYIDEGVLQATSLYPEKSFVLVSRNLQGRVTSVETDALEVNRYAAALSESILAEIKTRENDKVEVPLGALTGHDLLSVMGFNVPYRIIPAGKVTVSPVSGFDTSGINQTIHRLQMEVEVNVRIIFPLMKKEESVKRTVIVSETIIIGDVPDTLLTGGAPIH